MMNEIGIDDMISCYTMIPWALSFDYYDEATNRVQFLNTKPGDAAYADYWGTFLKDFSRHLREKGWFEKTAISMDERPMERCVRRSRLSSKPIRSSRSRWPEIIIRKFNRTYTI